MTKNIKERWRQFAAWVNGADSDTPVVTPEEKRAARPHPLRFLHGMLSEKNEMRVYHIFSVVMCLVFTGTLLLTVLYLPTFGGAILGAGLILFENAFGEKVRRFMSEHVYHFIKVAALYFYGFTMIYVFFTGANGLHSIIGTGIPGMIFSAGVIMPINVAVGLEVACTMYAFYAFFSKGEL